MSRHKTYLLLLALLLAIGNATLLKAQESAPAQWTTYRADNGRTGFANVELPNRLKIAWAYQLAPPSPAWPPPSAKSYWQNLDKIEPRVIDDQALHPVVTQGAILVGSSSDDSVVCLDAVTGQRRWRVTTDGPVRYAPAVWQDRVLIASDDGWLRCVQLADGKLAWQRRVGPERVAIPGNGRIISPFPLRSGVLVADGIAYTCAGLFPSQGVFAVAYDIATGETVWRRDLGNRSPQGYLLATPDRLIIPSGRGNPFSLRLDNGEDGPSFQGVGGTFAVIEDDQLVSGRGNDNSLVGSNAQSGQRIVTFPGEHLVVTPRMSFLANTTSIAGIDRARSNALKAELAQVQKQLDQGSDDEALARKKLQLQVEIAECILWTIESERVLTMAATTTQLFIGLADAIEVRNITNGELLDRISVTGEVRSISLAEQCVVLTTDSGEILCLGEGRVDTSFESRDDVHNGIAAETLREVEQWFAHADTHAGYLVAIDPTVEQLLAATERAERFHIVAYYPTQEKLQLVRQQLHEYRKYGSQIAAHLHAAHLHAADETALPLDDHVANVVVDRSESLSMEELNRIAAPGRSVILRGNEVIHPAPLAGAGSWTHQFANLANTSNSHDAYTTSSLQLKWFGGPGPRRMVDRHLRAPPPLAAGGRTFVTGENRIIGIDSYNGVELWDTPLPESQRYAMPYDAGYIACRSDAVFAAVDEAVWRIEAATGKVIRRHALPDAIEDGHHWGYVGVAGDRLFGTSMLSTASRTTPGRHLSDQTYRSEQPTVTSRSLFQIDLTSGDVRWLYDHGVILNTTIAIQDDLVCFIEARGDASRDNPVGRMPVTQLLEDDPWIVVLNTETGDLIWEKQAELNECRNIVYTVATPGRFLFVGSRDSERRDAQYHLLALDATSGKEVWRSSHGNQQPGQLYHGEQVHHPVVLGDTLVAEPFLYDLATGEKTVPNGESEDWFIRRPGHSCGTMSGSRECLFFRASNPTVMNLTSEPPERFRALSPSRVGCWINILPADGLVIIPEASSSCVCHFSLQTSMAFRPLQPAPEE